VVKIVRKKQQLLGIFTSKTVLSICVQLTLHWKAARWHPAVVGEADKYFLKPIQ